MVAYIGLGSNLGDRKKHFEQAIGKIKSQFPVTKMSSVYETPALLPKQRGEGWNLPFLNMVIEIDFQGDPRKLLFLLKEIETHLGRGAHKKWSPRNIDMDILAIGDGIYEYQNLHIPHRELGHRSFVLSPFAELNSSLRLPMFNGRSVLQLKRKCADKLPAWMHIVNVTPDSFSDGGQVQGEESFKKILDDFVMDQVQWVDVGAESTRPSGRVVPPEEEWSRLHPFIEFFQSYYHNQPLRPKLSVDTRNAETAKKALSIGAEMINDVSGLSDPEMVNVLKEFGCDYVLMHSLSVPANREITMSSDIDEVDDLTQWLQQKLDKLDSNGIDINRVVFDPGIGFGKTAEQSLNLLRRVREFHKFPVRLLVGHSRKSFMSPFSPYEPKERDPESIGMSMKLAERGVDILRVHQAAMHAKAFLGLSHIEDDHENQCHNY